MDAAALETFLTVHRCGGVSAAAEALSRTQSAISRRLALLEGELGARLFERVGRRMVLNEAGAALLPHAERVAAALDDARSAVHQVMSGTAGTVRAAVVGTLANQRLSAALRRVQARLPGLDIRLQTATSAEVSALVRSGEVSVGLRYFADRSPDIECHPLLQERLVVVCGPAHRLAGKRVTSLVRLAGERWLAFPAREDRGPEAFAATVFAQFLTRGMAEIDWVAIDSLTAQKRLIESGFGLAMLQRDAVEEELSRGTMALVRVDDLQAAVPVVTIVRRGGFLSIGARAVLDELRAPIRKGRGAATA